MVENFLYPLKVEIQGSSPWRHQDSLFSVKFNLFWNFPCDLPRVLILLLLSFGVSCAHNPGLSSATIFGSFLRICQGGLNVRCSFYMQPMLSCPYSNTMGLEVVIESLVFATQHSSSTFIFNLYCAEYKRVESCYVVICSLIFKFFILLLVCLSKYMLDWFTLFAHFLFSKHFDRISCPTSCMSTFIYSGLIYLGCTFVLCYAYFGFG